ncbi:MAG TPA: alpha/beta hydrolase [Vicinamibacterales bacterium]|nr:alpha/beta hydrolase [Vicinamibacterales bacterium]
MVELWIVFAVVAALVIGGAIYQHVAATRQARSLPAPGQFIDVGGHRLHVHCVGRGDVAVVFESGIAASSVSWALVQPRVGAFARACVYDRAGLAWSDAASCPRTFARIVDEFASVVAHAAPTSPLVLVGHSFGTFVVQAYAAREAGRVAGLVLVDPPVEWLSPTPQRARLLRGGRQLSRIGAALARVGIVRASLALLTGGAPAAPRQFSKVFGPTAAQTLERLVGEVRKLPPELYPVVQSHWSQPKCFSAMADYLQTLADESRAIASIRSPADVAVVVISGGHQPAERVTLQRAFAARGLDGTHIVAEHSGHWVQFDQPEIIVDAVQQLARSPRRRSLLVRDANARYRTAPNPPEPRKV